MAGLLGSSFPAFIGGLLEQNSAVPYNRPLDARQSPNVSIYHWSPYMADVFNAQLSGQTPMPGIDYPVRHHAPAMYQGQPVMPAVPQNVPGQQMGLAGLLQQLGYSPLQNSWLLGSQFQPASALGRYLSGLGIY
jgi:hypothetical protein